jgi:hypothetical protein
MPDDNSHSPRRRPVDVLFGEEMELKPKPAAADEKDSAAQAPGYMVEAPRPVTVLRPPPPEFPSDWRVAPPEPVSVTDMSVETTPLAEPVAPPPVPVMTELPRPEPIAEAVTFTTPERQESPLETKPAPVVEMPPPAPAAPAVVPPMVVAPPPLYGQTELVELSQFVDQLYQNVADETSDSAALNAECLTNLNAARMAIEKGEYARAETAAEQVKARLLRARTSRAGAAAAQTRVLFGWLIIALVGGLVLFLLPFVFRLVPAVIPLLRGIGMGMLGGAAAVLWHLTRQIAAREYDPAFVLKYSASPLLGGVLGAVLYLLSLLGILAAPNALGIPGEPWLMYLFALGSGFFGDRLFDVLLTWRK